MHLHQAEPRARLDDESAWHAANPGIAAGIKSIGYMRDESRRVAVTTSDQASFRALDLNRPSVPSTELLVGVDDFLDSSFRRVRARPSSDRRRR